MGEATAKERFDCPACGGDARWDPAAGALACPYCGTRSPKSGNAAPGAVQEHDLVATLRDMPDEKRGWKAEKKSVRCQSCQAISVFDPARVAQRCEFCGSSQIIPHEQVKAPISPESLLPFAISEPQVRDALKAWIASRWFAPGNLRRMSLTDTVKGLYLPYWTFDAHAEAQWTADAGYYYNDTEYYTDAQGKRQTRTVRKVRWVPASGHLKHFFDDVLVCGSKGVHPPLLRKVEPFPTQKVQPYSEHFVAGWVVEQYQIDLAQGAGQGRSQMDQTLRDLCARQVPGDTHRNLRVASQYNGQSFKHILLPIWLLTYNYGSKCFQVVANGVTGDLAGERPYSVWKILGLILLAAAAAGIVALASR